VTAGEVIWPGGRGVPITRVQARAILAEQAAARAAKLPEPLSWDELLSWLRSVVGRHAEVAVAATGLPPAPFLLRGVLGEPEPVDHDAYGACFKVPVLRAGDRVGHVLLAPAPAFQQASRRYIGRRPVVEVGMAMHASAFHVSVLVDIADAGGAGS